MDDDEYYSLQHHKIPVKKNNLNPHTVWQGREDEDMLHEKQSSWSAKKDDDSTDYSGSEDS